MKLKTQLNNLDATFVKISKVLHVNVKQQETIDNIVEYCKPIANGNPDAVVKQIGITKAQAMSRKLLAQKLLDIINRT